MRRKNKLVFAELEKELSIIHHYQMLSIVGGGNVDTIEDVVRWAQSMGIPFTVDGQNQYKDSNGNILLSPVDVYAWATDFQNPNPNPGPKPTTTLQPIVPTDDDIMRSYALYFGSMGFNVVQDDEGNYYCTNPAPNDPWKRVNGELVETRTQEPAFTYSDYGINMTMEEYNIRTAKNENVSLYKVSSVIDPITGQPRAATVAESGNCLGYALTGKTGYWILDNPNTPTYQSDEGKITDTFLTLKLGYQSTTNKSEATLVIVYDSDNEAIHAGIVNSDGTYSAKGGTGAVVTGMTSEAQFLQPYGPNGASYASGRVVYYK